jgi:hypothetical protein
MGADASGCRAMPDLPLTAMSDQMLDASPSRNYLQLYIPPSSWSNRSWPNRRLSSRHPFLNRQMQFLILISIIVDGTQTALETIPQKGVAFTANASGITPPPTHV